MQKINAADIARMIDHSLLKPDMTRQDIVLGCEVAKRYQTASVCVKPCDVVTAYKILQGTAVRVSTVIGFPHGAHTTHTKVEESKQALDEGCVELDMVLNIGRLLGGEFTEVRTDIEAVCREAHAQNAIVKVILENAYLGEPLIAKACQICSLAGADYVKTSTGFAPSGAKLKDLRLMKESVSEGVRIKAAGGVRTLDAALKVQAVGVSRFGATATEAIMKEALQREKDGILHWIEDDGGEL